MNEAQIDAIGAELHTALVEGKTVTPLTS